MPAPCHAEERGQSPFFRPPHDPHGAPLSRTVPRPLLSGAQAPRSPGRIVASPAAQVVAPLLGAKEKPGTQPSAPRMNTSHGAREPSIADRNWLDVTLAINTKEPLFAVGHYGHAATCADPGAGATVWDLRGTDARIAPGEVAGTARAADELVIDLAARLPGVREFQLRADARILARCSNAREVLPGIARG